MIIKPLPYEARITRDAVLAIVCILFIAFLNLLPPDMTLFQYLLLVIVFALIAGVIWTGAARIDKWIDRTFHELF